MKKIFFLIFLTSAFIFSFNTYDVLASCNSNSVYKYINLIPVKDEKVLIYNLDIQYDIPKRIRLATGTIKNVSDKDLECFTIILTYYDKDNNIVGRRGDGTSLLPSGKTWNFAAIMCDKHIERFEVTEIYYETRK